MKLTLSHILITFLSLSHAAEHKNQSLSNELSDIVPKVLSTFHENTPILNNFFKKPSDVKQSITLSLVCREWRNIVVKLRTLNEIALHIPDDKKLITHSDYQTIQESGYLILRMSYKSFCPSDPSNLACLKNITWLNLIDMDKDSEEDQAEVPKEHFHDSIKYIGFLKNLRVLNLTNNNFVPSYIENILTLKNIIYLDLSFNKLDNNFLLKLVCLCNLKLLRLLFVTEEDSTNVFEVLKEFLPTCEIQGLQKKTTQGKLNFNSLLSL